MVRGYFMKALLFIDQLKKVCYLFESFEYENAHIFLCCNIDNFFIKRYITTFLDHQQILFSLSNNKTFQFWVSDDYGKRNRSLQQMAKIKQD